MTGGILKWREERPTQAFLVAFDISGFSRNIESDALLRHRQVFLQAVANSEFYKTYSNQDIIKVHFLGDELRLAIPATTAAGEVRDFALAVLKALRIRAETEQAANATRIRGTILAGTVVWRRWHDCEFIAGELPLKTEDWMAQLAPGELAFDAEFKQYLDVAGLATDVAERTIAGERGFILAGVAGG